jgi:hypothetical protein
MAPAAEQHLDGLGLLDAVLLVGASAVRLRSLVDELPSGMCADDIRRGLRECLDLNPLSRA